MALTETSPDLKVDDKLYDVYCTISEAISKKRRVRYFTERIRFNKENQTFANKISKGVLFTPKWLYQVKGELYMVGYSNTREKARAVSLKSIVDIKIAPKFSWDITEKSLEVLDGTKPQNYVPEDKEIVIYKGPVDFICKDKYIGELYHRFGPPCKPVTINSHHKTAYSVSEAVITTKTLFWLSGIEEHGIRLKGPNKLIESVQKYYSNLSSNITKAVIVSNIQNNIR